MDPIDFTATPSASAGNVSLFDAVFRSLQANACAGKGNVGDDQLHHVDEGAAAVDESCVVWSLRTSIA